MTKKLLLAEDSLTIRKVFDLAFARSDVAVTAVDNGMDAVRLAGEILPDLVVADVTLPEKSGYDVAAELRAAEKTRDIPVLILSGSLVPLDEQKFRSCRASGVLFKPFESQELMEKVEGLIRRGAAPPAADVKAPDAKAAEGQPADELWDFSDVLEEVEEEAGKAGAGGTAEIPLRKEEILAGVLLPGDGKAAPVSYNEFDVSVEEIEGKPEAEEAAAPPAPPEPHLEGSIAGDSPPAVTELDIPREPEEVFEEVEEMEELEEVEFPPLREETPMPPADVPFAPPAAERPSPAAAPSPAEGGAALDARIREQFAARAEEIFRTVAAEAVEKATWEMMDRLAAEFSAKVRESIEAVAWEVIPATAEALIREEIARIRQQAGKPSP
jgi:DNA-binding response OmpR family regulator